MSVIKREWCAYAEDIMRACEEVLLSTKGLDFESFMASQEVYEVVLNKVKVIGSGVYHLPQLFLTLNSKVDWRFLIATGWALEDSESRLGVDDSAIWSLISDVIPILSATLQLATQRSGLKSAQRELPPRLQTTKKYEAFMGEKKMSEYVFELLENCESLREFMEGLDKPSFLKGKERDDSQAQLNKWTYRGVLLCLQRIGWLSYHLPREAVDLYPHVDWQKIMAVSSAIETPSLGLPSAHKSA